MLKYFISAIFLSLIYTNQIDVLATESAMFISSSSNGDSCCTPGTLGWPNASTMSVQGCWWHSVYYQCFERKYTAIWRFDLPELPEDSQISSTVFQFNQSGGNGHSIFVSNQMGPIEIELATNLYNAPNWNDYVDYTYESSTQTIEIPLDLVLDDSNSNQINLLLYNDGHTITNFGENAPKLVIDYITDNIECSNMTENDCLNHAGCIWEEDISWSSCSNLSWQECENHIGCYVDSNPGWYDNSGPYCTGGSYQIDNSYCYEAEYLYGDINYDSMINIQDIILTIDLIAMGRYNIAADMDTNGEVNILDIIQIVEIIINN